MSKHHFIILLIKFFKKEEKPDYCCWSCKQYFHHSKVKWKIRPMSLPLDDKKDFPLETIHLGMNLGDSSPNDVFGGAEYEYVGDCPNCKERINCLWFGEKSLEMNFKNKLNPIGQDVICYNCKTPNERLLSLWFSDRVKDLETNEIIEYLQTICKGCNEIIAYPLELFDLQKGIIK